MSEERADVQTLSVRVSRAMKEKIDNYTFNKGITRQKMIENAINKYLSDEQSDVPHKERVMVFIDVRNVTKSCGYTETDPYRIDYSEIVRYLVGKREYVAGYVFDGSSDTARPFHDVLRHLGFRVIVRDYDPAQNRQKEVDVSLATTMLSMAYKNAYDTAILISGDRDFIPSIEYVQAEGKKVEVAAFKHTTAAKILSGCDGFTDLDEIPMFSFIGVTEGV